MYKKKSIQVICLEEAPYQIFYDKEKREWGERRKARQ
jgi:hypothetical protein